MYTGAVLYGVITRYQRRASIATMQLRISSLAACIVSQAALDRLSQSVWGWSRRTVATSANGRSVFGRNGCVLLRPVAHAAGAQVKNQKLK